MDWQRRDIPQEKRERHEFLDELVKDLYPTHTLAEIAEIATKAGYPIRKESVWARGVKLGLTRSSNETRQRYTTGKLRTSEAAGVRVRVANGERPVDVARSLGVSKQLVHQILKGQRWRPKDVDRDVPATGPHGRPIEAVGVESSPPDSPTPTAYGSTPNEHAQPPPSESTDSAGSPSEKGNRIPTATNEES